MSWDYEARNKHCGRKLPFEEMREDTWVLNGTSMNANHMANTLYFSHITNLQAILDGQPYSITTKSVRKNHTSGAIYDKSHRNIIDCSLTGLKI